MSNETTQKTDPVLAQAEQITQGLLALKEPHADQKCIELKATTSRYSTAVDEEAQAQTAHQTAKQDNKESTALFALVVKGVLAALQLERSALLTKLQFGAGDAAEDQGRLIVEVLEEEGGKGSMALALGLQRAADRMRHDSKALSLSETRMVESSTCVVDSKLELQSLIAGDRVYLSKHAPPGHPAREALKRKTRPPTRDPAKVEQEEKARNEKEQAKRVKAQARADAKLAKERAKFARAQARLQAKLGLSAPTPEPKPHASATEASK